MLLWVYGFIQVLGPFYKHVQMPLDSPALLLILTSFNGFTNQEVSWRSSLDTDPLDIVRLLSALDEVSTQLCKALTDFGLLDPFRFSPEFSRVAQPVYMVPNFLKFQFILMHTT